LQVGQKYKIISNNKIESYELKGADCIKIDQKNNEIIATNVGIKKGYIYRRRKKVNLYFCRKE
jgi:hypothetical protein